MLARGVNYKWGACLRKGSTQAPVHPHIKLEDTPRVAAGTANEYLMFKNMRFYETLYMKMRKNFFNEILFKVS